MTTIVLLVALLGPVVGALADRRPGRSPDGRATIAGCGIGTVAAIALLVFTAVADTGVPAGLIDLPDWIALSIDRVAAVLLVAVLGTSLVVASFSRRSLDPGHPRTGDFMVGLAAVATGSALVVVPGGPLPLVVGWLLAGRGLVHLASGWVDGAAARRATDRLRSTMLVGDVALIAVVTVAVAVAGPGAVAGAPDAIADLADSAVVGLDAATVVALLVVVAGAARSALVPFHRWLTATLYAPTPVSALVHAGFVSAAGLLLIRFAPTVLGVGPAVAIVLVLATATIAVGTAASLTRSDAKGALAWSTVAQMAFMILQCAVGAFAAAVFHIVGHGMYKAAQFLGVGDTVLAQLRSRRSPDRTAPLSRPVVLATGAAIAAVGVAVGSAIGPSGLDLDERVLVTVFAWCSLAAATTGILGSRALGRGAAVATATAGALTMGIVYFIGLRAVKTFLEPSVPVADVDAGVAVIVIVGVLALLTLSLSVPGAAAARWRVSVRQQLVRATEVRTPLRLDDLRRAADSDPAATVHLSVDPTMAPDTAHEPGADRGAAGTETVSAAELRADVARAAEIVAPAWPLASFVAVNPLGGLEDRSFDEATAEARRWARGRTHRTLAQFRADHAAGLTTTDDLAYVAHEIAMVACGQPTVRASGRAVEPIDVVMADLLYGPQHDADPTPRTTLERRFGPDAGDIAGIDDLLAEWLAAYLSPPDWRIASNDASFVATARSEATAIARRSLGAEAASWIESLPDDPVRILRSALDVCAVRPVDRVDEIRGHLVQLPGWTGFARWRTDWAAAGTTLPDLHPIDIAAARSMLEAAVVIADDAAAPGGAPAPAVAVSDPRYDDSVVTNEPLDARVDAAMAQLDLPDDGELREAVRTVLSLVPDAMRSAIWLRAQERRVERDLLTAIGTGGDTPHQPVDAQVVFCIDVRSEGLRRHLEAQGHDRTVGFAGFFGVPMSVRELGWPTAEARCPVLVSPAVGAVERPVPDAVADAARQLTRTGLGATLGAAHAQTKHLPGAAFATAETLGWFSGPAAAWRTLTRPKAPSYAARTSTAVEIDHDTGFDTRVFIAESVLRTMGLSHGFADLVVLCGHTSLTVNNGHATALECGACAGASGAGNARAVAGLLNEPDVRQALTDRGISIPDRTWFTPAVHDTSSDTVTILDRHLAPPTHLEPIDALQQRLDRAGELQADARAAHLPGCTGAHDVRRRGNDWAQVRPEWGLASNAAFVIGPRSLTADTDLAGRAFLHSYDAADDPDGRVLETIMTAPLVVGHWISSQYYFSTVDTEIFGAGDKLLHNPIGAVGVTTGATGDLRIGLPEQSTHLAGAAHHQPLRLLAVVEADIGTIESIIARNEVLARLVNGSWIHLAARSGPGEPWSTRSPGGTWTNLPERATDSSDKNRSSLGDLTAA